MKEAAVAQLIRAFGVRGHSDGAGRSHWAKNSAYNAELDPLTYGLTIWDLDRHFYTGTLQHAFGGRKQATLREIVDHLRSVYCWSIGCVYMYIQRPEQKAWVMEYMETPAKKPGSGKKKLRILEYLLRAEEFEHFLDRRFHRTEAFFAREGAESTHRRHRRGSPICRPTNGGEEVVIGMAHRGTPQHARSISWASRWARSSPSSRAISIRLRPRAPATRNITWAPVAFIPLLPENKSPFPWTPTPANLKLWNPVVGGLGMASEAG